MEVNSLPTLPAGRGREYLGHADPGFTLPTYTHLMEGSSERTRRAIDTAFLGEDEDGDA